MKPTVTSEQTSKATELPGQLSLADRSKKVRREHAGATAVIVAITAILFAPVFQGRTFSIVGAHMFGQYPWTASGTDHPEIVGSGYPQTDQAETFYPATVFTTNAIRSGQLPMWSPYSFSGIPIMEVAIATGLLYPPKVLAMPFLSPIRQHDFSLFTHFLFAALGMYALLRCWGANALGATLGAIVWELNGNNTYSMLFEHVAITAAWFPLVLLSATLAIRRQSFFWAVTTGVALGMSVLNGSFMHVYVGIIPLGCLYLVLTAIAVYKLVLKRQRKAALLCISLPVVSAIVAITISAASWLATVDLLSNVHRRPQTVHDQIADSISISDFAHALIRPQSATSPAGKGPDTGALVFVGFPALLLALLALLRRSKPVMLGLVGCVLSIGFALGFKPLITLLDGSLPYFGAIHTYTGWYLFCFAIAVLAAFGLTEAGRHLIRAGLRIDLLIGLGCLVLAVEAWQLISFAWIVNPVQPATTEWLFPETPLISTLRSLQGEHHILPVSFHAPVGQWIPPVLAGKVASNFDLRSSSGYESLLPLPTAAIWRTVEQGGAVAQDIPIVYRPYFFHDRLPIALLEKISVGLLATPPGTRPRDVNGDDVVGQGALQLVYRGSDGWIYRITAALPRAFLVPQVVAAPDTPTALVMLTDWQFDARNTAIVIGEQTAAGVALPTDNLASASLNATANIVSDRLNSVEVEFVTPRAAMMVLNDSWDPGWKAFVDGVEHPVLRVNYAFRGVVVPEGQHRVLFLYRPPLLLIGLAVSGISLVMVGLFYAGRAIRIVRRFLSKQTT